MVYETRKQSLAWMEHGFQILLKKALSVEDKMAAGAFGALRIIVGTAPLIVRLAENILYQDVYS